MSPNKPDQISDSCRTALMMNHELSNVIDLPGTPSKNRDKFNTIIHHKLPGTPSKRKVPVQSGQRRRQLTAAVFAGIVFSYVLFRESGLVLKQESIADGNHGNNDAQGIDIDSIAKENNLNVVTEINDWTLFRDPNFTINHLGQQFQPWKPSGLPILPLRNAAPERLVAIGDCHGDLGALQRALTLAGAVDGKMNWIGGNLVILQTGDNVDRGPDEMAVLVLLQRLRIEAAAVGGAVHVLLGNHELMNVALDFRFVATSGFTDFRAFASAGQKPKVSMMGDLYPMMYGRAIAFQSGGIISSSVLAERNVAIIYGDTIFVHAGLDPKFKSEERLNMVNQLARDFAAGKVSINQASAVLEDEDGPVWTRRYSMQTSQFLCDELRSTLKSLGLTRLVVGHTPQEFGISPSCDGAIYRIDTGMAASFKGLTSREIQVLEITTDGVKIIKENEA